MNVVTKSGTNRLSGSGFVFFRDDALNARTTTESGTDVPKSDYRRWQYGGSAGGRFVGQGPLLRAVERVAAGHVSTRRYLGVVSEHSTACFRSLSRDPRSPPRRHVNLRDCRSCVAALRRSIRLPSPPGVGPTRAATELGRQRQPFPLDQRALYAHPRRRGAERADVSVRDVSEHDHRQHDAVTRSIPERRDRRTSDSTSRRRPSNASSTFATTCPGT